MRKFTPLALVSLVLCLGACVKTDLNDENGSRTPGSGLVGDGPFYMSFRLAMAGGDGTRADYVDGNNDFVYGSEAEYAVRNFMILFFNDKREQVYHVTSGKQTPEKEHEDIEKKFGELITISLGDNETAIEDTKKALESVKYFVTILNYNPAWDDEKGSFYKLSLHEVNPVYQFLCAYEYEIENKDKDGKSDKGNGFVMSTAGHYKGENDGNYIFYDTCDANDKEKQIFYQTISDAQNHPVTITVERLAARVDIEIIENIEPIEVLYGTDVYELNFVPDRWGLEAEEKNEFIMKNQRERGFYGTERNYPEGYGTWTDYKQHRTFWANSPTFEGGRYAWKGDENNDGSVKAALSLKYTTFRNLSQLFAEKKDDDGFTHKTASAYTTEHTFDVSELSKTENETNGLTETKNPYAVPTSIVVGGKYNITYLTTDERPENPSQEKGTQLKLNDAGFYLRFVDMERTDNPKWDGEEDDPERDGEEDDPGFKRYQYRLYRETNDDGNDDLFEALLKEQFVIFYKTGNEYYPVNVYTFFNGNSVASEIFEIANTSANQYTLQLKSSNFDDSILTGLYYAYYDDGKNRPEYNALTLDNIAEANKLLKNQLGYAQRYFKGYAFFYAPIPHYTGKDSPFAKGYSGLFNYKKNPNTGAYEIDATTGKYVIDHKNGEFGVVRNHIYKITVDHISTLGQGIPSLDAIPLPEPRIEHDIWQFDLTLKVLPWNQFQYTFDI